jgi:protocatechuate 3,4-dioxygenase alpha subunit
VSDDTVQIPSSSQTVGPYFRIGLDCMIERTPAISLEAPGMIAIEGRVLDRDGAAVPDAMLEFWIESPEYTKPSAELTRAGCPTGFRRVATGIDGEFSVVIELPVAIHSGDDGYPAPYFAVLVFARGLLRHLLTRVYLGEAKADATDPLLLNVPEERRATLVASADQQRAKTFHWDIRLQGTGETVFFAW